MSFNLIGCSFFVLELPPPWFRRSDFRIDTNECRGQAFPPAATWSSIWYLLSSFAVISYTDNWVYVGFAAIGSWIGAYASLTYLHRPPGGGSPVGASPE